MLLLTSCNIPYMGRFFSKDYLFFIFHLDCFLQFLFFLVIIGLVFTHCLYAYCRCVLEPYLLTNRVRLNKKLSFFKIYIFSHHFCCRYSDENSKGSNWLKNAFYGISRRSRHRDLIHWNIQTLHPSIINKVYKPLKKII